MKKNYLLSMFALFLFGTISAQEPITSPLFKTLKSNDSLLFDVGFNTCNIAAFEGIMADDLEFYHDKGGVTKSKENFLNLFRNGICKSDEFVSRRELVEGSLKVFPLYDNGKLYGAIQEGQHRFFETPKGKPEQTGSIASFTHLWIKHGNDWKVTRVLSYDHQMEVTPSASVQIKVSKEILKSYAGNYKAPQTGLVSISVKNEALEMKSKDMEATLYPESPSIFFHKQAPLTFEFIRNNDGSVLKLIVRENGTIVEEAVKTNK